jgi:RHS repeat-associated protein
MTYNQANQLKTAVVSGTTSTYTYDAFGIRQKIKTGTSPFQVTQYDLWGSLLTETSQAAAPVETDYAYMDGMPIAAIQPAAATISALHTDNLGTVLRGTNSTKTVVYTANFNPNGGVTPTTTITQNLRYPGQHVDSTGAYYNINRYYDPSTVTPRYWQVDPLGLAAGMNPYVYALNNPFKHIDPWGLFDPNDPGEQAYFNSYCYNDPNAHCDENEDYHSQYINFKTPYMACNVGTSVACGAFGYVNGPRAWQANVACQAILRPACYWACKGPDPILGNQSTADTGKQSTAESVPIAAP